MNFEVFISCAVTGAGDTVGKHPAIPVTPKQIGLKVFKDQPLDALRDYIDWSPFFHTWELKGRYPDILEKYGIASNIPDESDRERIDTIIFKELVNGIFLEESRLYFNQVIQKLKDRGCDAVVLGCTEIPLIVNPSDCPLPTLDSTRLLARAAIKKALKED